MSQRLRRRLLLWGTSYFMVAVILLIYYKIPLIPLLCGGVLTLAVTVLQHVSARRQQAGGKGSFS